MIVLGDAGINYYANEQDIYLKNSLLQYPMTFFCIHGNHEERPENIEGYKTKIFHAGLVYYKKNILIYYLRKMVKCINLMNKVF